MVTQQLIVAHSLNDIVRCSVRALVRRYHISRDWIIGLVGLRGSGKSLGGANIAVRDFSMEGDPLWSNMQIKMNVKVDDDTAQACGLTEGGIVTYEAKELEKQELLNLDGRYEGGCVYLDEPNVEYGEARRSSSNTNLKTDLVVQQLRKLQCGLVYSLINEMYIDWRIRDATDLFIKCRDVAFNGENLQAKMAQGKVFEWDILPMTARVCGNGNTFSETGRPALTMQITLGNTWGLIDTYERQVNEGKYSDSKERLFPMQMGENPEVKREHDKWGWLDDAISRFYDNHQDEERFIEISSRELQYELGVRREDWPYIVKKVKERIPDMESRGRGSLANPLKYLLPQRLFKENGK